MKASMVVVSAGLSSTLQDRGRMDFVHYGVSTAGAFDPLLAMVANRLVDNSPDRAVVEIALKGDEYEIDAPRCRVGFAGDFSLAINGQSVEPWRSYTLVAGQRFAVGAARQGLHGYLAVAGGFQLQPVLGSKSVHARTGIGPLGGRPLKAGDRLPIVAISPSGGDRRFNTRALPSRRTTLRVVIGPQAHYFSAADVSAFLASEFEITTRCDRMGYQLAGPAIEYRKDIPLISEGVALGSVQVLDGGVIIVTLVDRQTTGGYPKLATVISPDIRDLAHLPPKTKLRFAAVSIEEAQSIRRNFDAAILGRLDEHLTYIRVARATTDRLLSKNLISGVTNGLDEQSV